jgi:predicted transcriptional regulator of viral defense system
MEMGQALELLGAFTAEQWGMVTSRQATGLGVDGVTLHRLEKAGFLDRVRRGVYAATTATVTGAREEQAAWLALNAAGPAWKRPRVDPDGGVVSHRSAARLHGLGELVNDRITFTTPRRRTSRDPDLWFRTAQLADEDVTVIDGLPVTTALRTICDLLDQHIDGSHIATIIRQAVEANQVRLDTLAEHIGPYALRYGVRRPGDGEALLEQLLAEIGTTIALLARRPGPPRYENTAAAAELALKLVEYSHAMSPITEQLNKLTGGMAPIQALGGDAFSPRIVALLNNISAYPEIMAAAQIGSPLAGVIGALGKDVTAGLVHTLSPLSGLDPSVLAAIAQAGKPLRAASSSAGDTKEDTASAADDAADNDGGHGTAATEHTPRLRRLAERQGQEQVEGDRRPRR